MGGSISVSSVVDRLHALDPRERAEAFDKLYFQHKEISNYCQILENQRYVSPKRLFIRLPVPTSARLDLQKLSEWTQDPSSFWKTPHNFLPEDVNCSSISSVYCATQSFSIIGDHASCLQHRYIGLFWFDYASFLRMADFEAHYIHLAKTILGQDAEISDAITQGLRALINAGRRYNLLATEFGPGILLTLPSSIGRSTIERKMPLKPNLFKSWIQPLIGTVWVDESEKEEIKILGDNIRKHLRNICIQEQVQGQELVRSNLSLSHLDRTNHSFNATPPDQDDHSSGRLEISTSPNVVATPTQMKQRYTTLSTQTFIATLIYAMGNQTAKIVFDRVTLPQARWTEQGEFNLITTEDVNLHRDLRTALSNPTAVQQSLSDLMNSQSENRIEVSGDQHKFLRIGNSEAPTFLDLDRSYWISRAFELCCHIFPRDEALDSSFFSIGRILADVVYHLVLQYITSGLVIPTNESVVETLVAASNFGKICHRQQLLDIAATLQNSLKRVDLEAMIVLRKSKLLRLRRKISESRQLIETFLNRPQQQSTPRSQSLLGLLCLSQGENWAYEFNHEYMYSEAQKWSPGPILTAMELGVFREKLKLLGKFYKSKGLWVDAKSTFESCLEVLDPGDSNRLIVKAFLTDVYCELYYLHRNNPELQPSDYLAKAENLLQPELDHLSPSSRSYRRLLLSLIEVKLLWGKDSSTKGLVAELLETYHRLPEHDINDQVGHVRALIARARLSTDKPFLSLKAWRVALDQNITYDGSEECIFGCGVLHLYISLAYWNDHDLANSIASFHRAEFIINNSSPQFLIPGIATYLYDFVRQELWSATGWSLPAVAMDIQEV